MSFTFSKQKGKLIFKDLGGFETRNASTMWCIQQADLIYQWDDFKERKVHTGDHYCGNDRDFSVIKKNLINLAPDFVFHQWPQVGLEDYETFVQEIDKAGVKEYEIKKVGWIGVMSNETRGQLIKLGEKNPEFFDFFEMSWKKSDKIFLNSTNYIYTPDLVKKYAFLLDIEGGGPYSARLKTLLWSHRPLLLVSRPLNEYFFEFLVEWEHYIPVQRDLSDLLEKTKWCLDNYESAKKIGENAYQFSLKFLTRTACYHQWNRIIQNYHETIFPVEEKNIFLLWLQGWDQAPWLHQQVKNSWYLHNPNWKLHFIDLKNLKHYVQDIDYIYDPNKNISDQAKSDIIRLSLLKNHGGVWADATLLCMQPLDSWVYEAVQGTSFWMYHGNGGYLPNGTGPASWFIVSNKNGYIIRQWKNSCDTYWNQNNSTENYNWMDYLFCFLYQQDYYFNELWSKTLYLNCEDDGQSHTLADYNNNKVGNFTPKIQKLFLEKPPYVLKLWNNWDTLFPDKKTNQYLNSNGYFALQMAKRGIYSYFHWSA